MSELYMKKGTSNFTLSVAVFSTINTNNKATISPFIACAYGKYYFEGRYNYESPNSASINVGRLINRKFAGFSLTPMTGLVTGTFRGLTTELQAERDTKNWNIFLDNQFSLEYSAIEKSFYYNWTTVKFKINRQFQFGTTMQFFKQINQKGVFDRGLTVSVVYERFGLGIYAYNYEPSKRNYFISLRYRISN